MSGGDTKIRRDLAQPRVTIGELAAALGLTKGTVSRALNGYADISEATRLRVTSAAKKMGYSPRSYAQAIRTGYMRSLGLVLQVDERGGQRPFLAEFLAGLSGAASAENWTLTIATATSDADVRSTLARLVAEHKADGFILPRTRLNDPRIDDLRAAKVPFVLFGRADDPTDCAWYDIAGEDAMFDAVLRLAEFGHERIGFVGGGAQYVYSGLRLEGYKKGLAQSGLSFDPTLVRDDAVSAEQGAECSAALLALSKPPTAIVFAVDRAALGLYATAADLGLTVGRDVSTISYDGIPEGAYAQPPLTTFAVDSRKAGERLAQILIARIRGTAAEDLRELGFATLIARGSDGPPTLTSDALARRLADPK